MTGSEQAVNLISFFAGELRVVTHECSFDLAVGEASMLTQLASRNPLIKVALRY